MSVPAGDRKPERLFQCVEKAKDLLEHTIKKVKRFPKAYTFKGGNQILDTAYQILQEIKEAEGIDPTNSHEAQLRIDHYLRARGLCHNLEEQIYVMQKVLRGVHVENEKKDSGKKRSKEALSEEAALFWGNMANIEANIITGVLRTERQKQKKLLEKEKLEREREMHSAFVSAFNEALSKRKR